MDTISAEKIKAGKMQDKTFLKTNAVNSFVKSATGLVPDIPLLSV